MNARVLLSQAAYVTSWLSGVVMTVGQGITHRALHAHFTCADECPCDLDGIVNLPAFRVRIWAKKHPTFSIRSRSQSRWRFCRSARNEGKVRRQPASIAHKFPSVDRKVLPVTCEREVKRDSDALLVHP